MRPLTVRLKPWESRKLRQLRDRAASARTVKRAMCLLMSAAGQPAHAIAATTGLSLDAVSDIRRRWRRRGLRSLHERPRPGRPPRVTAAYLRQLRRALRLGPRRCGYVFTVWSIARLRAHLRRRTGIRVSVGWLRRLVHGQGFVVGRPKHTLKGRRDERAYQRARRRLERLKKGLCGPTPPTSSGTPTPASSICCPTWSAAGCPRGGSWP